MLVAINRMGREGWQEEVFESDQILWKVMGMTTEVYIPLNQFPHGRNPHFRSLFEGEHFRLSLKNGEPVVFLGKVDGFYIEKLHITAANLNELSVLVREVIATVLYGRIIALENEEALFIGATKTFRAAVGAQVRRLSGMRSTKPDPIDGEIRVALEDADRVLGIALDKVQGRDQSVNQPWQMIANRVRQMDNARVRFTWDALGRHSWGSEDYYDRAANVSMDDWAQMIYGEMSRRGLPTSRPPA